MNFTLFGYSKTGKTTLFNLLTGAKVEVKSYEDGKKEPNLRTCAVPDPRLNRIATLYPEKEKKPAFVDYVDLAGMSYGEVKDQAYLSHLRKADGLANVVRGFHDVQIPHPRGRIDPRQDILAMEEELILADLVSVESRLEKLRKELTRARTSEGTQEMELLERLRAGLESGQALRELHHSVHEIKLMRSFAFLSQKPLFHLINVDEKDIPLIEKPEEIYRTERPGTLVLAFCGLVEMEILELEERERQTFLEEYGLRELSAPKFLRASYGLLGVITFFTIGKEEVKAWTIPKNSPAEEAAAAIHTDIAKGFIRAEVISWQQLLELGSFQEAKDKARIRLEGKDYTVQDGDVIYFRFAR